MQEANFLKNSEECVHVHHSVLAHQLLLLTEACQVRDYGGFIHTSHPAIFSCTYRINHVGFTSRM